MTRLVDIFAGRDTPAAAPDWHSRVRWSDPAERKAGCERWERERANDLAAACAAGRCRYAGGVDHGSAAAAEDGVCDGYLCVEYLEHGQTVFRTRMCDRQIAWWRVERERRKRAKAIEAARLDSARKPRAGTTASTWRGDDES